MSTPNNKKRSSSNSNKKTEEKKAVGETKPLSEAQAKLQIRSLLGKRTSNIQKVQSYEDKIIEVCDQFGITPNVPVKGKQPGSRGKLTVKDIFGHDSEAEDDDNVQELGSEDDEDETDESVKEPRKKTLRMESDEDKKKKKKKKSLGSFTIDLNINH